MRLSICIFFPVIFLLIYFACFLTGFFFWIVDALCLLWKLALCHGSKSFLSSAICLLKFFIVFSNAVSKLWIYFLQKLSLWNKKVTIVECAIIKWWRKNIPGGAETRQRNCSTYRVSREERWDLFSKCLSGVSLNL